MDTRARDPFGRFLPGVSGNPQGRPPQPPSALHSLADTAAQAVLAHDLALLQDERADPPLRREALNRLARLGARRISSETRIIIDEAGLARIVDAITRHVTDLATLDAIARDLEGMGP